MQLPGQIDVGLVEDPRERKNGNERAQDLGDENNRGENVGV